MKIKLLSLLLMSSFLIASPAFAYLDPGTGSVIVQVLIAGVFGALLTIKTWWSSVRGFFSSIFKAKSE